jgi:hypothetical protein
VIHESIEALASHDRFRPLIDAPTLSINDQPYPGLAASCTLLGQRNLFERLEATPVVLLHGDLILENILWSPLLLIDPVSVAGLTSGHPLFDLVKYESYASGELFAIREEIVTAEPRGAGFLFEIDWGNAQLAPFRPFDLRSRFRAGYERRHGEIDRALYALLDGYFSLVMARNTTGAHQWARVIKGCQCLATAAGEVEEPVTDP